MHFAGDISFIRFTDLIPIVLSIMGLMLTTSDLLQIICLLQVSFWLSSFILLSQHMLCLVFLCLFSECFNKDIFQRKLIKVCAFSKIYKLVQIEARFQLFWQSLKFAPALGNSRGFCQDNQGFFPVSIAN